MSQTYAEFLKDWLRPLKEVAEAPWHFLWMGIEGKKLSYACSFPVSKAVEINAQVAESTPFGDPLMNIADPFTMLSEIFDMLGEDDLTCNECKRRWQISHGCTIQWEHQGVEWVDFELSCDCDIEDTAPYPCIRYDGETVEFFMRTLPVENVTKCIKRENPNTDVDTKVWHRIGQHIGIPHNEYWHWSKMA